VVVSQPVVLPPGGQSPARAAPPPPIARGSPPPGDSSFRRRVRALEALHVERWRTTDDAPPILGEPVARPRQRENAVAAERLLEEVARRGKHYPDSEPARRRWRAEIRETVRRFGEERLGWPDGYRSLLLAEAFYEATARFVRETRAFDPDAQLEDVGQALRNVWVMNSLQLLLDHEIAFSPAIFAYSMLYPCTDNFLDDPSVSPGAKADFCHRLSRRLCGEGLLPRTVRERRVFGLVGRIETQYARALHPAVFWSLTAIHRAQEASLVQQRAVDPRDAEKVLEASVAKGGASLLADGYLVQGDLGPEEAELSFGYGVFLQLLDDLQDVHADREAGHATLFTIAARAGTLDRLAGRLHRFMSRVLCRSPRIAVPAYAARKDLILRNCTFLFVGAVAEHRDLFSPRFLRGIEERWPFDLVSMRRLRQVAARRYRGVARALARRTGARSPLDLL
jgi:hypothetical protein